MSHFNKKGNPFIIDVSKKNITERSATATGEVKFNKDSFKKIKNFKTKKGNLEQLAIVSGIMGAKETSKLIPLCHNISINHIEINIKKNHKNFSLIVESTVKTNSNTGVEMEALVSVSISCLTIYDMCKSIDKSIQIKKIRLLSKKGGKSNFLRKKEKN